MWIFTCTVKCSYTFFHSFHTFFKWHPVTENASKSNQSALHFYTVKSIIKQDTFFVFFFSSAYVQYVYQIVRHKQFGWNVLSGDFPVLVYQLKLLSFKQNFLNQFSIILFLMFIHKYLSCYVVIFSFTQCVTMAQTLVSKKVRRKPLRLTF